MEYTCEPGYRLEGETIRTCEADGAWGGEEPVCVPIVCQPPPPILNGQYDYKDLKVRSLRSATFCQTNEDNVVFLNLNLNLN